VPGPSSGRWANLARYLRDPIAALTSFAREYGDVVHVPLGPNELYLVSDPDLVRDVLVTRHRSFHKSRAYEEAKRLLGNGLLTSEDGLHRRQRRLLQPLFVQERIVAYGRLMGDYTAAAGERWQPGATLDVNEEMSRLTLAIVGRALLDADVEGEAREVGEAIAAALAVFNRFLLPFSRVLWALPLPSTRRFERSRASLDRLIARLIAERRAGPGGGGDLLSLLLSVRDEEGEPMSDRQVRDEAVTILLAGHETTALALAWAWYLLAQHPDVEAKLHEEVDRVLAGRPASASDLAALTYTRMVLAETLRLYPPAWAIARRALVDHELGGYRIPAGSIVFVSQAVLHRDARSFPEPERFDPERWHGDGAETRRPGYLPFGAGPRLCIGERFAWMEGVLVLATLAGGWRLRLVRGQRVAVRPIVTLRPKRGIRMRLEARG
jgi:cytochrome P450